MTKSIPRLNVYAVEMLRHIHNSTLPLRPTAREIHELMLLKAMGLAFSDHEGWRLSPTGRRELAREDGAE